MLAHRMKQKIMMPYALFGASFHRLVSVINAAEVVVIPVLRLAVPQTRSCHNLSCHSRYSNVPGRLRFSFLQAGFTINLPQLLLTLRFLQTSSRATQSLRPLDRSLRGLSQLRKCSSESLTPDTTSLSFELESSC